MKTTPFYFLLPKVFPTILFLLLAGGRLLAQEALTLEKINEHAIHEKGDPDSTSLLSAFKRASIHGHFRYFFMATDNVQGLTDYYANAIGGGIKLETAPYRGFQFGVSGFFVFNAGSSDLTKIDEGTNQPNRYEIGLFDVEDPSNRNDIDRLEELYLKYGWRKSHITLGKQLINTPFINLQDGRMRPTAVNGIYGAIREIQSMKIEFGYLYEISPRSTARWYSIGNSIGRYPSGVNRDGAKSAYAGNLESNGIWLLGFTTQLNKQVSIKAWEMMVSNIFNTALVQLDLQQSLTAESKLTASLQYIRQDALKDGGNADPSKTFFEKGGHSTVFGARAGWEDRRWQTSLNFLRITAGGRYLMPREWGKDPFFTFLPRERNEGVGDVYAYMASAGYTLPKKRLRLQAAFGYYDLPPASNFAMNKYGMPSYTQLNVDVRYAFKGFLEGLDAQLLFVHKEKVGSEIVNEGQLFNKADMRQWNVVLNYHF